MQSDKWFKEVRYRVGYDYFWFSKEESDTLDVRRFCTINGEIKEYTLLGRNPGTFKDYVFVGTGTFSHTERKKI